MAIVTDQTITVHGVSVGISKPIQTLIAQGDFTYPELSKFAYTGRYDFINDACAVYDNANNEYGQSAQLLTLDKYPILNDPSKPWDTIWYQYHGSVGRTAATYGKMILVYDFGGSADSIKNNFNDDNTACIVTELNPRLLKMSPNVSMSTITASLGEPGTYTVYDVETAINIAWYDDGTGAPFRPLCISEIDGHNYYFFPLYNDTLHARQNIAGNTDGTYAQLSYMQDSYDNSGDAYLSPWASSAPILDFCPGHDYGTTFIGAYKLNTDRADKLLILDYHGAWDFNGNLQVKASSLDAALKQCAACGLYFEVNGITYKPLTAGGIITGYTTELDKNGEWDLINDVSGNTIPDTPGGGGGDVDDEDNKDPISTTGAPFSSGLCHYYALTAGSTLLEHISEALGTWDIENTHKDLYKNLVSCKLIKPPAAIPTTGSAPFTIYGVKPQYQGADITLPVVTGNPEATFGPYTIDRKFGDFRDYAPYTRVSIYLPYCGWCDLPSHVVGRSVTVKYFTDIIAATCKAVVFCNNSIIAEAAGVIGLDIPFVADNVGAKMQAVTAGMIAALGGGIQLGAGIGTMVSTKSGNGAKAALSGASQYLSGYSQMAMAFNENTTEISGKNGDGCCLSGATNIIIKIVRPKKGAYTTAPFTPPGYGHNVGFVSQKQVKVSSVSGLLIADNVDTSGISGATEAERAEIKRVLETGLIVNAAPE